MLLRLVVVSVFLQLGVVVHGQSVCPFGTRPTTQTSTGGVETCPSGSYLIREYDCEQYNCGTYYQCNPYECNCRESCTTRWCTFLCCETVCDTCYQQCPDICYRTCEDCQFCENTPFPTFVPTKQPTRQPTLYPTRAPSKAPIPTPEPTNSPSKSPTMYPTSYPTDAPSMFPSLFPTEAPVPPTTPDPTAAPVPTPEPTPPTVSPTLFPTKSPTPNVFLSDENLLIFGIIFGAGGGLSIAAFIVVYRRRKSHVDTTGAAEELLEWKAKHASGTHNSGALSNPMYGVEPTAVAATGILASKPNLAKERMSLKGLNVHQWLQDIKEEEKKKHASIKAGTLEPEPALKMKMKFDFVAENDEELDVKKGDVLLCLDKRDDWFVATNPETGESGLVPASYVVQYLDDEDF